MKNNMYARLDGRLVSTFGRAPAKAKLLTPEAEVSPMRAKAIEEIRRAHAEMETERVVQVRPPSLVEHQNRDPRLRRTVDEIAHYAVSVAAAEAGMLLN